MANPFLSQTDSDLALQIAQRAGRRLGPDAVLTLLMDLQACHFTGCALDLAGLLAAPDGDFFHDVMGINRYLDRSTGGLTQCFVPRYAAKYLGVSK